MRLEIAAENDGQISMESKDRKMAMARCISPLHHTPKNVFRNFAPHFRELEVGEVFYSPRFYGH